MTNQSKQPSNTESVKIAILSVYGEDIQMGETYQFEVRKESELSREGIACLDSEGNPLGFYPMEIPAEVAGKVQPLAEFLDACKSMKFSGVATEQLMTNKTLKITIFDANIVTEESLAKAKEEAEKDVFVTIGGSSVIYPQKKQFLEAVVKEGDVYISIQTEGDKVIAYYKDQRVGEVTKGIEDVRGSDFRGLVMEKKNLEVTVKVLKAANKSKYYPDEVIARESKRIIEDGALTEHELNERLQYMAENKISKLLQAKVLEQIFAVDEADKHRVKTANKLFVNNDFILEDALVSANSSTKSAIYEGPKACGKNTLTHTLSWLYNLPVYEFQFNGLTSNEELVGTTSIKAEGTSQMVSHFELSDTIKALAKRSLLVLDEVNMAPAYVVPVMQGFFDGRKANEIPMYGLVQRHEHNITIGTMNANYAGTDDVNPAFLDRFTLIKFSNKMSLVKILRTTYGDDLDEVLADKLDDVFKKFREMVRNEEEDAALLTIRGFEATYEAVALQGASLLRALKNNVVNKVQNDESIENIMDILERIVG